MKNEAVMTDSYKQLRAVNYDVRPIIISILTTRKISTDEPTSSHFISLRSTASEGRLNIVITAIKYIK